MIGQISKISSAIISLALAGCIKPSASTLDLHQSIEEQTHETWKELTDKNFENLYKFNSNNKLALLITENGIDQNYLQIAKDISGIASLLYLSKNNQAAKEKYKLITSAAGIKKDLVQLPALVVYRFDQASRQSQRSIINAASAEVVKEVLAPKYPGVTKLTKENLTDLVINSPIPVLIDSYADNCGPCIALKPALKKATEINQKTPFRMVVIHHKTYKYRSAAEKELMKKLNISHNSFPAGFVFYQGKLIAQPSIAGSSAQGLTNIVDSALKSAIKSGKASYNNINIEAEPNDALDTPNNEQPTIKNSVNLGQTFSPVVYSIKRDNNGNPIALEAAGTTIDLLNEKSFFVGVIEYKPNKVAGNITGLIKCSEVGCELIQL